MSVEKRTGPRGTRWTVRWRDGEGAPHRRTFQTRADAERFDHEIALDRLSGGESAGHPAPSLGGPGKEDGPDLRAVMEAYVAECALLQAPSTARQKAILLEQFLGFVAAQHGPEAPCSVLTKDLLKGFYSYLGQADETGHVRTLSTRAKMIQRVVHAWQWAANEEAYDEVIPKPRHLRLPKAPRVPTIAPTWAEIDACIRATLDAWGGQGQGRRAPNVPLYRRAVLLRFTGLRVQQAMGLLWSDVDLEHAHLTVRGELGKTDAEKSGRIVPLSAHLVEELRRWREGAAGDAWILPSERTGDQSRTARQRDMVASWQRAGVRLEAWTGRSHHAFRKGFVSELRRAGADPDAIEYLVGHSLQLRGVYTDPDALPLREAVALIPPLQLEDPQ